MLHSSATTEDPEFYACSLSICSRAKSRHLPLIQIKCWLAFGKLRRQRGAGAVSSPSASGRWVLPQLAWTLAAESGHQMAKSDVKKVFGVRTLSIEPPRNRWRDGWRGNSRLDDSSIRFNIFQDGRPQSSTIFTCFFACT
jgi:hypothetical protein